ncbi:hypothetical protein D3C84_739600 [compost metagenome]
MRFGVGSHRREEAQHHDNQRTGRQVRLNAVPGHGNQPANNRRNIRPEHAESQSTDHRIGHCRLLAGSGHQIGDQLNDTDTAEQRDQHLPTGQPQRKQAGRKHIAANAVHVAHPERKDVVPIPFLRQRSQVLVVQARAVAVGHLLGHRGAPRKRPRVDVTSTLRTGVGMVCIRVATQNACHMQERCDGSGLSGGLARVKP